MKSLPFNPLNLIVNNIELHGIIPLLVNGGASHSKTSCSQGEIKRTCTSINRRGVSFVLAVLSCMMQSLSLEWVTTFHDRNVVSGGELVKAKDIKILKPISIPKSYISSQKRRFKNSHRCSSGSFKSFLRIHFFEKITALGTERKCTEFCKNTLIRWLLLGSIAISITTYHRPYQT